MHVPINDGHAPDPVFPLEILGGDGDVVEDAEAHPAGGGGMMPGRAHGAECRTHIAAHHGVRAFEHRSGSLQRHLITLHADRRVPRAELVCESLHILMDDVVIPRLVRQQHLGGGRPAARYPHDFLRQLLQRGAQRAIARGGLGMPWPGVVAFILGIAMDAGFSRVAVHRSVRRMLLPLGNSGLLAASPIMIPPRCLTPGWWQVHHRIQCETETHRT
jgi:hypothetical protein